jgi:uncharacterized protein YpmB
MNRRDEEKIDKIVGTIVIIFAVLFVLIALSGCAHMSPTDRALEMGIVMEPEEVDSCKSDGCMVITTDQLQELFKLIFEKGYQAGVKAI